MLKSDMRIFARWLVPKIIRHHDKIDNLKVRAQYGTLEGWVSIVGNLLLFCLKITLGVMTRSMALIADAIHTLSDSATSVVILVGFKMAKKPSDKEHPFGHGRIEFVAALIVAVLLFSAGVELMEKSIRSIIHPSAQIVSLGVIGLIGSTILVKELMARFAFALGDMIDSQAIKADALHHRTDALSTVLVVIALISVRFGFNRIDGLMGFLVSVMIFYSAYEIGRDAIHPLLGVSPSKETLKKIEALARKEKDVLGVHDIIFHQYGRTNIISLHIEVPANQDPITLHELSEKVEDEIVTVFGGMAVVHIDPINNDHPQYAAITETLTDLIQQDDRVNSFHELRIVGRGREKCNVVFDISLSHEVDEQEKYDIIYSLDRKFRKKFPQMKTVIKAEPPYAFNL